MKFIARYLRAWQILFIAYRYGLADIIFAAFGRPGLVKLCKILRFGYVFKTAPEIRARQALERLGPIFVKLGQVLSTRRDLLPTKMADELAKLQDRVPPFASEQAIAVVEQAFGKKIDQIFIEFDAKPIASASIAQVHFAKIADPKIGSKEVAVKVLRPNMLKVIEKDLSLMYIIASSLENLSADGRRLKPREVVQEFDKYLHDELDLFKEASNATQLKRNLANLQLVRIPEIYWDYCRQEVMVMERMRGISIGRLDELREAGVDLTKLARTGVTAFFTQVFRDGFFHADMHPGNIHISLEPENFGQYILLDFGIVGTLTETDKEYLAQNFVAFFKRDYKRVAELHIESGWVPATTRVDELEGAVRSCCEPFFDRPLKEISLGIVLMRLFQASRRFQVEIQPQLTLLQKTLLNVEGLGRELDPDMDLWTTALPFLEQWMKDELGIKKFIKQLTLEAPRFAKLIPELPRLYHQYLQQPKIADLAEEIKQLRQTQQKQNKLANNLIYILSGFAVGMLVMLLFNSGNITLV